MANWSILKAAIAESIKNNGNQEITGQVLQNVLNNIVSSVGENSTFAGVATPTTNPGTPDGKVFYLATETGTYSNFDGIKVEDGEAVILEWKGSWAKKTTGFATAKKIAELDILSNIRQFGIIPISYPNKDRYWNNDTLKRFSGYFASDEIDISEFAGKRFITTGRALLLYSFVKKTDGTVISLSSLCNNYISNKDAVNFGTFPNDADKLLMSYDSNTQIPSLVYVPNTELLLDEPFFIVGKFLNPANGQPVANSAYKYSNLLPLKAFKSIAFSQYSAQTDIAFIAIFDSYGNWVKSYNGGTPESTKTFNISDILSENENAKYFAVSSAKGVIIKGIISMSAIFNSLSEMCNANIEQMGLVSLFSNNVFEKPRYTNSYLLPSSEAIVTGYNNFNIFGFINIDVLTEDNPIIIDKFRKRADTARLRLFDKNLSFLMNHIMNDGSGTVNITREFIKSLDSRTRFVLVQQHPGETISYKTSLKNLYVEPYIDAELYGKTYIAIGDSITQGISQGTYSGQSYSNLVAQKYNMTYLNNGLGGTCVRIDFKDNSMMIAFVTEEDVVIDAQEVSFLDKSDSYWKFTTPKGCKKIKMTSKYLSSFDNTGNIVITKGDVIGSSIQLETKDGYVKQFGDIQFDSKNKYIEASVDENSLYTMSILNVPIIDDTSYVGRFKSVIQDFLKENPDEEPFITIYGGTNDHHGLLTEGTQGTIDMFNVHTFYGAFNYMLKGIYDMLPKVRLGVFTINNPIWSRYTYEENMEANNKVNETIRNVCAKWSTPVLDLAKESGVPTKGLMSNSSYEILCPDGVHFNKFSHIKVSRKVAQFLKTL